MFFPATIPPPARSPTVPTSRLPPVSASTSAQAKCPKCNTQLATATSPTKSSLLSPINVSTARFASSSSASTSASTSEPTKFKDERLESWRHLCGLDVPPEDEPEEEEHEMGEDEDDSEDEYDARKPYAALLAKPKLSAEEREQRRRQREEWAATTSRESAREKQLRQALEHALGALDQLTQTNADLVSTHQDLQASLKIARSNLAMAEANSEMLEDSLRRGTGALGQTRSPITPSGSGLGLGAVGSHKRVSSEAAKSGFGFWNRFKDSPAQAGSVATSPIQETAAGGPRSPTQVLAQQHQPQLQRSSSYSTLPSPTAPSSTAAVHAKAMAALNAECAELKRSKAALEDELEGLSQALFEEANKMVADERRKLAEKEDEVREAREERDALRRTINVLGGGKPEDQDETPGLAPESIPLPPPTPSPAAESPPQQPASTSPNPWAAPSTLTIPPLDDSLPQLDRPRTPAENLDGLLKEMEGEFGK